VQYCPNGECAPAPGAVVSAGNVSMKTDANGDYVLAGLPPGTYTVTVVYRVRGSQTVTVPAGGTATADFALK
jgi:hypothetical protein